MAAMTSLAIDVLFVLLTILVSGVAGETCPVYRGGGFYYETCSSGCCGRAPNYYCCNISTAAIAGIILGGIVLVAVMVFACAYCMKKKTHSGRVIRPVQPTTNTIVYTGTSGHYPSGSCPQHMPAPPPYKRHDDPPPYAQYGNHPHQQHQQQPHPGYGAPPPQHQQQQPAYPYGSRPMGGAPESAAPPPPPAYASAAPAAPASTSGFGYGQNHGWGTGFANSSPSSAAASAAANSSSVPGSALAGPSRAGLSSSLAGESAAGLSSRNTVTSSNFLPSRLPPLPND